MDATYNRDKSWEKQSFYDLDNGYEIAVESSFYGCHLTTINDKNGNLIWHCSSGLNSLPAWAHSWITPIAPGHWDKIVCPKIKRLN